MCSLCSGTAAAAQTLPPPKHLCALEQDVLQEVSCAIVRIVLKPAARVDPDAHCGCLRVGVGLGSNPQTIWQSGHLQSRTSGNAHAFPYPKAPAVELLRLCIVILLTTVDASAQVNPAAKPTQLHLQSADLLQCLINPSASISDLSLRD